MSKNYILIYYQQIKDGSVTVGHWIEKWYEYESRFVKDPALRERWPYNYYKTQRHG